MVLFGVDGAGAPAHILGWRSGACFPQVF